MAARRGGRGFKLASVGARVRWLRLLGSGVDEIVMSVWRRGSSRGRWMEEAARPKELGSAIVSSSLTSVRLDCCTSHTAMDAKSVVNTNSCKA